jgi:hypothetical protein
LKSGTRALTVSIVLLLLWGNILTGPFRYFAYAFRDLFIWIADSLHAPTVVLILCTVVLLVLSSKKFARYMAGICALLSMLNYLLGCLRTKSFDTVSFTVTVGLALALLFLILQADKAGLWLADAYIFSIPVLLFFELVLTPLFVTVHASPNLLSALFTVPESGIATRIGNLFSVPMLIWSLFLFALMLIPVVYLSRNRKKS